MYNGNTIQLYADGTTNTGTSIYGFNWNNVYYAPSAGVSPDVYSPLTLYTGTGTYIKDYSADYERDTTNILGTAVEIRNGSSLIMESPIFNWLARAIYVPADGSVETLIVNSPNFDSCTVQVQIDDNQTLGYLSGNTDFSKVTYPLDTPWYITSSSRRTVTVALIGQADFIHQSGRKSKSITTNSGHTSCVDPETIIGINISKEPNLGQLNYIKQRTTTVGNNPNSIVKIGNYYVFNVTDTKVGRTTRIQNSIARCTTVWGKQVCCSNICTVSIQRQFCDLTVVTRVDQIGILGSNGDRSLLEIQPLNINVIRNGQRGRRVIISVT